MRIGIGIVLLTVALQADCTMPVETSKAEREEMMKYLNYIRDPNTGQCFAVLALVGKSPARQATITWVPCEPKVLERIAK